MLVPLSIKTAVPFGFDTVRARQRLAEAWLENVNQQVRNHRSGSMFSLLAVPDMLISLL